MNFTRAVIPKGGYSKGFCIPSTAQDRFLITGEMSIYFTRTGRKIKGVFSPVDGAEERKITETSERPAGGFYLFVTFPKGWINSKHVNVFWDEKEIIIKEIPE